MFLLTESANKSFATEGKTAKTILKITKITIINNIYIFGELNSISGIYDIEDFRVLDLNLIPPWQLN